MIRINVGSKFCRLRGETEEEISYLETLNKPEPVGYMMYCKDFLISNDGADKVIGAYHAEQKQKAS